METTTVPPEASDEDLRSALQASEIRYRRLFESAQDGIFILNAETVQIDDANPFLVVMLGYTHAELLGKKLWEVGMFADKPDSKAMFKELQEKGYVRYEDLPLRTRDGRQVAVEFVSNAYDSDGVRVIQCNVHDITERSAANAKALYLGAILKASELRYRRLFESAQDGILILNSETAQIDDVNSFLVAMLGYTHEEFLGKKLWEVGFLADTAESKAMFRELQTEGYVRYEDMPLRTRKGSQIEVEFVSNAYDCDGVRVIQCNVRDITERHAATAKALRAEAIMRTSEFRYRRLFESAQDGIFILNAETAQIDDANPFLMAMLGYTHAEFLGKKLWEVSMFADTAASKAIFLELQTKGYVRYEDMPLRTKDGRQIEVEFVSNGYDCDGVRVIQCNVRDITERHIAAAAIQAHLRELKAVLHGTVGVATVMGELRDPYTVGHERRVAHLARAIGRELGLDAHRQEGLWVAGSLHDVGKMAVPMEILARPGRINAAETAMIREHARAGFEVLRGVAWPWPVAEVALQHHERTDGSGYPQGLKGEAILLEARIVAVADVVEAMSSHRPYRAALGLEPALAEITRGIGSAYDEAAATACLRLFREQGYVLPP